MKIGVMFIVLALIATVTSGWQYWSVISSGKKNRKNGKLQDFSFARLSYYVMTGFTVLASIYLLFLILDHRFQFSYVYRYSSRDLPLGFLISSFWAGQEGSFLFWALMIALMGVVFIKKARQLEAHAMLAINGVQACFLAILLKASPFELLPQIPPDGAGLNPLLQNPWMVIHPPVLFIGYAAATFPFALAIAALIRREYSAFIAKALPWVVFTSLTLGAGIIIGGYWAYKVLGWGGYWGWDPVENSSLIPWLTTLALLHGLLLQRKTEALPKTNFILSILTFALVIYATFLTRSGVLADFSVHSFQDLGINLYLIVLILAILGAGFVSLQNRYRDIHFQELNLSILNREAILLGSMLVFSVSAFLTFIGTSSPLITGLLGKPAQVDISYYNIVHLPIGIALALFLGFAPYLRWQHTDNLLKTLLPSLLATAVSGAIAYSAGMTEIRFLAFTIAAAFAFWSNVFITVKLLRINWQFAGAPVSHAGVAMLMLGIIVSATFETSQQIVLESDIPQQVSDHRLTYRGITPVANGKNIVNIRVSTGNREYTAQPRFYFSEYNRSVMREPDVRAGLLADIYISPLEIRQSETTGSGAAKLQIAKGETKQLKNMQITFDAFDFNNHSAEGQSMNIGARLTVNAGGKTFQVTPAILFENGKNHPVKSKFILEENGEKQTISVTLNQMDANRKLIELTFDGFRENAPALSAAKEQLIVEFSWKPFMSTLWIGTILITIGTLISLVSRFKTPANTNNKINKEIHYGKRKEVPELSGRK